MPHNCIEDLATVLALSLGAKFLFLIVMVPILYSYDSDTSILYILRNDWIITFLLCAVAGYHKLEHLSAFSTIIIVALIVINWMGMTSILFSIIKRYGIIHLIQMVTLIVILVINIVTMVGINTLVTDNEQSDV